MDPDFRRLPAFDLVPFGGNGDQFAVTVAARDIGQHGCRPDIGLTDLPAAFLDRTLVAKLAQDSLQLGAVGILEAEFTSDFASPDLFRMRADESDDGVCGRKAPVALFGHSIRLPCQRSSSQSVLPSSKPKSSPSPERAPCWRPAISALPPPSSLRPSWPALPALLPPRPWRVLRLWLSCSHAWRHRRLLPPGHRSARSLPEACCCQGACRYEVWR